MEKIKMFDERRDNVYLGTDKVLKQTLEDSLNIDFDTVETTQEFARVVGDAEGRNLTIILTKHISASLRTNYEQVIDILEDVVGIDNNTVVIELGLEGKVMAENDSVFRYVDDVHLIKNKRRESRGWTVRKAKEEGQNEYLIAYKEFELEIEELKGKLDKLKNEKEKIDEAYLVLQRNTGGHETRLQELRLDNEQLEKEVQELKLELDDALVNAERYFVQLEDMRLKFSEAQTDKNNFEYDKLSLQKQLAKRVNDIESLNYEIKDLKETIREVKESKEELIHRMSGFDKYKDVEEQISKMQEETSELRSEKTELNIRYNEVVMQNQALEDRLEDLKKDSTEIASIGRSLGLDKCQMKNVNVFYFKIIQELPYFNTYLKTFIDLLNKRGDFGIIKTMIIRYDEGFDSQYFEGVDIYSNLSNAAESTDRTFRIFPSRKMFLGVEDFEDTVDTVIVLDYTKNRDYYVDTSGYARRFVVVNNGKIKTRLGIEGNEISLGDKSKLDMTYDREIANARVSDTRKRLVESKINRWMRSMEIIYD